MRPIWNRLKNNEKNKNAVKGALKIKLKMMIAKALLLFFGKILPIAIAIMLTFLAVSWVEDLFQSKNNPKTLYETIGKEDLNEMIAVAGNEDDGYYLAFKEGFDEKLDKIVEKYKRTGKYYVNKDVLLKMIQAELFTQYPNLGGKIGKEAKVEEEVKEETEEGTEEDTKDEEKTTEGEENTGNNRGTNKITSLENFLFIGDSITVGMQDLDSSITFKAVQGVGSNYWIEKFDSLTEISDVKGINVLLGTNDYANNNAASKFEELVEKLHEKYPNVTIFVDKLLPDKSISDTTVRDKYISDLKTYCDGKDYLVFIDPTSGVNIPDGGYHPATDDDYKKLFNNIKDKITSSTENYIPPLVIGEDTGEGTEGFQGGVRIRRVTPDKQIGQLVNTGSGQISSGQTMDGDYVGEINTYLTKSGVSGEWSVYAKNLKTNNEIVKYNDSTKKQSASLIKLFVMATAYQEMESNNLEVDKNLIAKMITESDNDATNSIINTLGNGNDEEGFRKINAYAQENGYEQTEINRLMLQDATNGDNYTSTGDVAKILEKIYNGKCVSKSASGEMLEYLKAQKRKNKIPAGVPDGVVTANKTGELDTVENDAAIVYKDGAPYILVVMSSGLEDTSGAVENIKQISKMVYENIDKKFEKKDDSNKTSNNTKSKKHVIALVAGHGDDSGAGDNTYTKGGTDTTGVTNPAWKETDKVKEVIKLVQKKFKNNKNITIITDGYGEPDSERLQIAKDKGADVFIEVHLGSNSDSSVSGTSTYYENDSGKKSGKLADTLTNGVMSSLGTSKNDGAAETNNRVLNKNKVDDFGGAAVILNGALMSNKDDMEKISAKDGLDKYAEGIEKGINDYIDLLDKGQLDDDEEIVNTSYDTSVKSKIIELKYVPQEKFDKMIEDKNQDVLNYYTLDGNWNIVTANWTYSSETGTTYSKNSAYPYRKVLQKYMTPYEYLMDYYIDIKEDDFIKAFADLVMKSEFIIAVQDNVTTTETKVNVQTVYSDGHVAGGGVENKDEITETVSDKIEVTYLDTWFVKWWKDSSYIYGNGTSYRGGVGSVSQQEIANIARNGDNLGAVGGYCEAWAESVYRAAGYDVPYYPCATEAGDACVPNGGTDYDNIPVGAVVFAAHSSSGTRCGNHDAGHVGIYVGNGEIASNVGGVAIHSVEDWISIWGWKGWGWYPGTETLSKSAEDNSLTSYGSLSGTPGTESLGNFKITAYCPCSECCGEYANGITSSGATATEGITIATDPNVIPTGSYVYFNDHVYKAEDVGGGVKGNHIDLYFNSHQDALNWGVQYFDVYPVDERTVVQGETSGDIKVSDVSYSNRRVNLMGKVTETQSSSSTSEPGPTILEYDKNNKWIGTIYSTIVRTTDIHSINNQYETGESHVSGNEAKFLKLFRDYPKALNRLKAKWLITDISKNDRTAPFVDLTKYLMYKLLGKSYGVTEFNFSIYEPSEFNSMNSNGGKEQFIRWLHEWEGINGSISADGTKYIIGDDGYGHPTVGYGIDIFNGGFADRFRAAGYSTDVGAEVDKEFVDNLEKEEIDKAIETVETKCSGLNLTQYQKYALVSRIFNCGEGGAFCSRNGKDFISAYNAYWNSDKDDEYKIPANENMFSHPLYSTYMYLPNTSNNQYSEGLVNRRRAEWLLFKTGYYDRINEYYEDGGDIVNAADKVHKFIEQNGYYYSLGGDLPSNVKEVQNVRAVCCATFVSWTLYEAGYDWMEECPGINACSSLLPFLESHGGQKISKPTMGDLQPGDILFYGGNGESHTDIYAGDGMWYNCGGNDSVKGSSPYSKGVRGDVYCAIRFN